MLVEKALIFASKLKDSPSSKSTVKFVKLSDRDPSSPNTALLEIISFISSTEKLALEDEFPVRKELELLVAKNVFNPNRIEVAEPLLFCRLIVAEVLKDPVALPMLPNGINPAPLPTLDEIANLSPAARSKNSRVTPVLKLVSPPAPPETEPVPVLVEEIVFGLSLIHI